MTTVRRQNRTSKMTAVVLMAMMLFSLTTLPASADVQPLQNAFNPRGFFVTLKSGGEAQWLRSPFYTGYYRSGNGGGGNGEGNGGADGKDELGHSNVQYTGTDAGLDYVDAADVDTIYSTYDHNPTPGKNYMIGYYKDEQAAELQTIPNFISYIGTPGRGNDTVPDPSGGQWWSTPIQLKLGEEQEDGTVNALASGTLYEFAFLRGSQANNGTTCVLIPGDTPGTYKGYVRYTGSETAEERALYEAHQYDEYEFITNILPEGSAGDITVDHTVETVPMRYRIQTYADLKTWKESSVYQEAEALLASVTEADYESGQFNRESMEALQNTLDRLNEEAEGSIRYQLQKDAEQSMEQMVEELKTALDQAKSSIAVTDFEAYNAALQNAEETYSAVKENVGTNEGQYRAEPVQALQSAIDHAKSTINGNSTQTQVDTETSLLSEARMKAIDALITPTQRVFTDSATGIVVTVPINALPDTAQLAVREVVSSSEEYSRYVSHISPAPDAAVIYRIVFVNGTEVVAPAETVTIQVPLSNTLSGVTPSVYYLDDTGLAAQNVTASAPEGYRVFTTSQMGTYALAGPKTTTPKQSTTSRTQNTRRTQTTRTTLIVHTTRDPNNNQNRQNEISSTSVQETRAVQPTTMITSTTVLTTATDTSDLEQDANPNSMLYLALLVAGVGIGTLIYQLLKDKKEGEEDDEASL